MCGAEVGEKLIVCFVRGRGVHLLFAGGGFLHALEVEADVVVGGVGIGVRLGVVVAPELAPGIEDGTGYG